MRSRKTQTRRHHTRPRRPREPHPWIDLPDDALLDVRLCDLGVSLEGTPLERRLARLYDELAQKKIRFRPACWLSDEWFVPVLVPGIAAPFYLAHPRLMKLERHRMFEVEGGTKAWCMRLLRHEAGHALEAAYRLPERPEYKRIFGRASKAYPDYYCPDPFSRDHVLHLDWWYSQSHPSEDFAETFAVWLNPRSRWQQRYEGWPVLAKLEYVDELMTGLAGEHPVVSSRARIDPLHRLRQTLRTHYREKRARYLSEDRDMYDAPLHRLFSADAAPGSPRATGLIRRARTALREHFAAGDREEDYVVKMALRELANRCRELALHVATGDDAIRPELIDLTAQVIDDLRRSDNWVPL